MSRRVLLFLLAVILPLLLGGAVYIAWRPHNLLIGLLIDLPVLRELLPWIAEWVRAIVATPPPAVLYVLPDFLWSFVLISMLGMIWFDEQSRRGLWLMAAIPFAMLYELAQWANWAPGTFDPYDLLGSALAALCSVIILDLNFKRGMIDE